MARRIGEGLEVDDDGGELSSVTVVEKCGGAVAQTGFNLCDGLGGDDDAVGHVLDDYGYAVILFVYFIDGLEKPEGTGEKQEKQENKELLVPYFGKEIPYAVLQIFFYSVHPLESE